MVSHNLPSQPTPFIDRTQELSEIAQRLADPACRLLTIVGPGGIGKTRLALRAAADHLTDYEDDVYFVSLVSLDSANLIASTIAAALNISLYGPDDTQVQVANYLCEKHILLVLDNFEPLLEGVGLLVDLLAHAPRLKFMVTSRERLNLQEEWVLPIEGMPYPTEQEPGDIEPFSAVRLFIQNARRIQPSFVLANHRQAVTAICQQVEGMPLALELAAGWLRVMSPEQIAAQLEQSLDFLTTPLRNVPERHRSLRAVYDYSWELLPESERAVLMKLSIFRDGFDLDAAAYVARATLPILAALVDKSLIGFESSGRYSLHELLRQYSAEKLATSGEAEATARCHLDFFLNLSERAEAEIYGPEQTVWFDRLEAEHGNLHAALARSLEGGEAEKGLRLAAALGWFWQLRVHLREGSQWFERLLDANIETPVSVRAKALHRASEIETHLKNSSRARQLAEESLHLAQAINDKWNTAWALAAMGMCGKFGPIQLAPTEEALAFFRELEDAWGVSHTLRRLALVLEWAGNFQRAAVLAEEALELARAVQDKSAMAWSLYALGFAQLQQDNNRERARILIQESLPLFREIGDIQGLSIALDILGSLVLIRGEFAEARRYFEENICLMLEPNSIPDVTSASSLAGLGVVAWRQGEFTQAATLLSAVDEHIDTDHRFSSMLLLKTLLAEIRTQLRDQQFAAAGAAGRAMTLEQAAFFALQNAPPINPRADMEQTLVEPLSKRELEVLQLVADGLSNGEIAQRLYLSLGTIKVHTRNIYGKLGVGSRTQAISHAQKLNLL
jgi:predicted ATPase/DNA-binding CsgD family transcriptional regulator